MNHLYNRGQDEKVLLHLDGGNASLQCSTKKLK